MSKRTNLTSKIFGRITVAVDLGVTDDGWTLWGCDCECGNKVAIRSRELLRGHTKSCGCLHYESIIKSAGKNKMAPGESALNVVMSGYIKSARERGYEFTLMREEFKNLTSSNCHYCGSPPSMFRYGNGQKNTNHGYIYNGIDRVNPELGYSTGNCVPCCRDCNVAKMTMSVNQFREFISRIYHHFVARFEFGECGAAA